MIRLKSRREIEILRAGGRIVAQAIQLVENQTRAGMTTAELNREIERLILAAGARPAFKGYRGFPCSSCISINEELVHGIPGKRVIREGDIVSADVGVELEGFFTDAATTVSVGRVSDDARRLVDVTRTSLDMAIAIL